MEGNTRARGPRDAYVTGVGTVPNGTHATPERDLATGVIREALADAGTSIGDVDGLYMPALRPWTPQKFFSTYLTNWLGLDLARTAEIQTGGTSAGNAFQSAVADVRSGAVDTALVVAVERNSIIETADYFEYITHIFDQEFHAPIGPTIPTVYAQSMQRYLYDYGVTEAELASIVVKNRRNATTNPGALFEEAVSVEEVLNSTPISDPLRLYECPAPCDGAAALVVSNDRRDSVAPVVSGVGYHHPPSHLIGPRDASLSTLPAAATATERALSDAGRPASSIDLFELYAPFPHVEAVITEELGLFERGQGARACQRGETAVDGAVPVSPSGGCIGRGHPAMVTPLLNYAEAVRQLRGTAANQVANASSALTTSEHGHVDGMSATVFASEVGT